MDQTQDARRAAFEQVVGEVVEPLRRFLARRTDPSTADDVLGDVLLVLWRRLDGLPSDPLPWAYGVARNCLANAERGARRQRRLANRIAIVDPPVEVAPTDEADERVREALAAMSEREAELLRLWAWEQLAPAEIATVLGISANAASIRLHRARGKFKQQLRKIDEVTGHEGPKGANDD
ncbi:sigma-70 family RNA polymerase sigma factor [Marmoricola sp. OAE513]|uniref:RNA polymerase sigma factor n=1 Tax=Marmoricola sp. OAE513 TaxID=2817894 RepID=UPI001AE79E9C